MMKEFIHMINAKSKLFIPILFLITLLLLIIFTLNINQSKKFLQGKAANAFSSAVRGNSGDLWADIILGKASFSEIVPNSVVPNKTFFPRSVIVDRSNPAANKMYVYDGSNSRILGIDLNTCLAHSGDPLNCSADIVIGQPASHPTDNGFGKTAACNGDSAFQNYPSRAPASASTLCTLQESQLSVGENGTGSNMYTDNQGNLYVTDSYNHRVLKYNSPFDQSGTITASDVWGQNDFTGNQCNKGQTLPDGSTLCFGWSGNNNLSAGVEIDSSGNLWVADSANNRILRFPPGSHTADLVLGQSSFTTKNSGSSLDQLFAPSAVRVSDTGQIFVADDTNNRVMVYDAPYSNGMSGTVFGTNANFSSPNGLAFDPTQSGKIWITNSGHSTVELWDIATQSKIRTLGQDNNGNIINSTSGSIGVNTNGDVFVGIKGANYGNDVIEFSAQGPYASPIHQLFGGHNVFNQKDQYSLESATSVVIAGSQLIVAEGAYKGGVVFWNIDPSNPPASLTSGKPADGYIIESNFNTGNGGIMGMRASNSHLYVSRRHGYGNNGPAKITVYNLPLTSGANESNNPITLPLNVLGGGQITAATSDDPYWSVLPASDDSYLWVTDADNSRVFRIRDPLTNPIVDVILGQNNSTDVLCNRTGTPAGSQAPADALCWPGWISQDRQGNIYVSDWSPENRGNWRLLEYDSGIFPTNTQNTIYAPAASKIFINTAMAELAFDSQNHMVGGYQRYFNINPPGYEFPGVYLNPLAPAPNPPAQIQPDQHLGDFSSAAFTSIFDSQDNLYVGDWARGRLEIYLNPLGITGTQTPTNPPIATSTPIPPTATPPPATNTPIPTPTPSSILQFSSISAKHITQTSADITWKTSAPGTSRVQYGTTSNNLNMTTTENPTLVINHTQTVSNLLNNTRYYYRVVSRNASGIEYTSTLFNFISRR